MHVLLARGSFIPDIASMREDFPALCQPMATIAGISTSTSTLQRERGFMIDSRERENRYVPKGTHLCNEIEQILLLSGILTVGDANGHVGCLTWGVGCHKSTIKRR